MRLDRPSRRGRLIGLTPLVDVVFILLVFFMLASTLESRQGLAVDPAGAAGGSGGQSEGAILVRVHGDGSLDIAGRPVPPGGIEAALAPNLAADPGLAVLVQADGAVPLQRLVAVTDAAAAAGARSISVTEGAAR